MTDSCSLSIGMQRTVCRLQWSRRIVA